MKKSTKKWLIITALICIIGIIGTGLIQTDFGSTKIENVNYITQSGYEQSLDIYIPSTATAETPAATVFVQHGGNNNKEEMQHYCIELARRGYVAVGVDMYGMGESQPLSDEEWLTMGRGLYDAVRYGVTLPYVDSERICLLGYSRGGKAAGEALECDNAELNVVKAIYLIHSDPIVRNSEGYTDVYGARDIGVLADKNDEFFFSEKAGDDGTYSNDANKYAANLSSPAEYIINNSAQSFLYFGIDPAETTEQRVAETVYTKEYEDGRVGSREINVSNETHMTGWWSPLVMRNVLTFFDRTMPTGTDLAPNNYTSILWNVFKLMSLLGLIAFVCNLIVALVSAVPAFKMVDAGAPSIRSISGKNGKAWYWLLQLISVVGCILIIAFLNSKGLASYRDAIFNSANPTYHGMIALLCGALTLLLCTVWFYAKGSKEKFSIGAAGISIKGKVLLKTIYVVLIAMAVQLGIVFLVDYLVDVNFLFIYWGFMKFLPNRIPGMILVCPMYILFYIALSISVNGFNFNDAAGKNRIVSDVVTALIAALPTLFVLAYVYGLFMATGNNPMFGGLASAATAVFAFPGFVFVATLVCRYLYRNTGNIYLGGILCGIAAAIAEWNVCEIRVHTPGTSYAGVGWFIAVLVVGFAVSIVCAVLIKKKAKEIA